jgi:hypothetical protein
MEAKFGNADVAAADMSRLILQAEYRNDTKQASCGTA